MRRAMLLALLTVVVGCSDADTGTANGPCGPNGECPAGYACEPRLDICLAIVTRDGGSGDARPLVDAGLGLDARPGLDGGAALDARLVDAPPTVGPVTTITPGFDAAAPTHAASVSFTFQAQVAATFACQVDGAGFSACSSPLSLTPTEGSHTLTVRATAGGQVEQNPPSVVFVIDRTAPVFSLQTVDIDSNVGSLTVHFTVAPTGDASGLTFTECALDGVACSCDAGSAVCGEVAAGQHVFSVAAKDAAQNQGPTATSPSAMTMTYGPNAGRVVLIGHDFSASNAATRAILAGAFAEVPFTAEKLGFTRKVRLATFRSASADASEVANALDAVTGLYDTKSLYTVTKTTVDDLAAGLRSRDVLLVFDQNDPSTSKAAGSAWADTLAAFVNAGGVVVVLDGLDGVAGGDPSNTYQVVASLLDVSSADAIESAFVDDVHKTVTASEAVNGDTSPLAPAGAVTQYSAPANTVVYTADATGQRWIYQREGQLCPDNCFSIFNPTVIEKVFPAYTIDPTFADDGFDGFSASPHVAITVATTPADVPAKRYDCSYLVEDCATSVCQAPCPTDGSGNFLTPDGPGTYDLEIRLVDGHDVPAVSYAATLNIQGPHINDYNPQLTNITCIEDETLPPRHLVFSLVETQNGVAMTLSTAGPPSPACSVGNVVFSFSYACVTIGNPVWTVTATDDGGNSEVLRFCDR